MTLEETLYHISIVFSTIVGTGIGTFIYQRWRDKEIRVLHKRLRYLGAALLNKYQIPALLGDKPEGYSIRLKNSDASDDLTSDDLPDIPNTDKVPMP